MLKNKYVIGFVFGVAICLTGYFLNRSRDVGGETTSNTIDSLNRTRDSLIAYIFRSQFDLMLSEQRNDSLKESYDKDIERARESFKIRYRTIYVHDTITVSYMFDYYRGAGADTSAGR